jgi:hypothetical protein
MYSAIRRAHLYSGLFCLAFLAMYEISGVQMAHRRWFPLAERVGEQSFVLTRDLTDARTAARELPLRGELAAARPSLSGLRFRIARPGAVSDVDYAAATGTATVRTTTAGVVGMLNRIHQTEGLWHDYRLLNAWAGALGAVSLGLLAMGATGLFLWFRNHAERRIGIVMLAAGGGLAAVLIAWMRLG